MKQTRREFLRGAFAWSGLLLAGSLELVAERGGEPLRRGVRYLAARQSADGAWRSGRYAAFRDGDVLTPLVLWAMPKAEGHECFSRGLNWLDELTDRIRDLDDPYSELRYPLFTASYSAQIFARRGDSERAAVWTKVIRALRTSEELGWTVNDPMCGAWSDASRPPRFVAPVPDMLAPNISATALAVSGLAATGCAEEAVAARPFIERCQNFAEEAPAEFDDGGFFFALDDPIRNKAGRAGYDVGGKARFHSYGSATCDGWLALRACGLALEHPRVWAATEWLRTRCHGFTTAGDWVTGRAEARESLVYYQAQALAAVLADLPTDPDWSRILGKNLVAALLRKQGSDGSWQGSAPDSCEDEPVLASAFAVRAMNLLAA